MVWADLEGWEEVRRPGGGIPGEDVSVLERLWHSGSASCETPQSGPIGSVPALHPRQFWRGDNGQGGWRFGCVRHGPYSPRVHKLVGKKGPHANDAILSPLCARRGWGRGGDTRSGQHRGAVTANELGGLWLGPQSLFSRCGDKGKTRDTESSSLTPKSRK